ncbi:hypothetical protein JB92DRAFT_2836656 [Gautieria morchelliformis]|nr:hypothetical protein JB92DRAFT_2836656 [Gautieria morchelliformis]
MPHMVIDSSEEEIEEIAPLPFKSSSGHVLKLSAVLLDPSNMAKVPGQPHSTRRLGESEEPKRKKAKPTGNQKQKEVPVPNVSAEPAMPIPPATIAHDNAHPEGWLKDLDGIEDLPKIHSKKLKEHTLDIQFFFENQCKEEGKKLMDCKLCRKHDRHKAMHEGKYKD